jgi:hypothetical protein
VSQWDDITSFANLCRAARRAARSKRRVAGAARFLERLEPEALALQRDLLAGTWRPSKPTTFTIHDPKERVITAAPFRDRVVHHALIDPLEPLFDAALVPESFACRRGRGTHRAVEHARGLVRTQSWFLKLDVKRCFDSIEHGIVLETLAELGLEAPVMELCARLLAGPEDLSRAGGGGSRTAEGNLSCGGIAASQRKGECRRGVGLPIGNLSSQWFANLVLGRLDRFILREIAPGGFARYMDDFVLFSADKRELREAHVRIEDFLRVTLRLALKEKATVLAPTRQGVPFLGWRLHGGTTRLRPENARRLRRRVRQRRWELREGRIGVESFVACVRSLAAHLAHGDTLFLRRRLFAAVDPERPGLETLALESPGLETPGQEPLYQELGSGSPAPQTA